MDIHVPFNHPEKASTAEEPLNHQMNKIICPIAVSLYFQEIQVSVQW